ELFGSRVGLEATYYNRVSHDALVTVDVLPSHGSFSRLENLGSVRNRGVEGSLRLGLVDTRPVRWDVIVGGSYNQNRLLELAPGITTLDAASRHRHVEGFPIWGMWERTYTYEDANGDGIIVPAEIQVSDTAVYIGPSHAPRELTVASSVELLDGRIRLGALLDRRSGHFRMDNNAASRCITARSCRGVNDPTAPLAEQAAAGSASSSPRAPSGCGPTTPATRRAARCCSRAPAPTRTRTTARSRRRARSRCACRSATDDAERIPSVAGDDDDDATLSRVR